LKLPPETFQVRQSAVVVFLVGAVVETQVDDTVLRTTFDLTMAESRLAASLLGGATLNEASKKLHVSRNTAHTQLKSIFTKVGVHRQAELIRVLLPLSVRRQPR
jgi:DNA-binding CsgD family transcriptional regulator